MSVDPDRKDIVALAQENKVLREALARAEDDLRLHKEKAAIFHSKVHTAAQTARLWVWESDIQGNYLWDLNRPSALGLDDVPLADLGARYFKMIDPADLEGIYANHFAALQTKAQFITHRYRVKYPDGAIRHLEGRGTLLYDSEGHIIGVVGGTLDVTSEAEAAERLRKQAAELHDAQRRLERASLSTQEGHWDYEMETQRCWVSSSYPALLGYAPDSIDLSSRERYLDLVHPQDREREAAAVAAHLRNGTPLDVEIRMRPADGEWRWMRVRGMAEFNDQRRPIRISGSIQDIHQKKLAEDNLQQVRQRFERAIRGTQDGLWEWDLQRNTLWVSPRYEEILGYAEGGMPTGIEFRQSITHPDDLERVQAAHVAHFERNVPLDVEVRVRHASGKYIWMRARGEAERDADGKPLRVAGSIQDVMEARAAHDALVQATQAAHAANQAKSEFLANVSHEIRTPMNGIIGMTTLLLDTGLNRTQLDYAETIRGSADSLLTVINDILDFSKIEAGKLDIELIELDLRRSVEDVGTVMAFQAATKNLELVVNVHPDIPNRVSGDPQRIRQCLLNLVGNAIKFTKTGEIIIDVSSVGREDGKVLTHFEVRDTGIGIAPDTASGLFQPFVQADSSTTRHYGGTGLGLSIVRRLVEMMGGKVGMQSVEGEGSTFWFTLPLAIVEPAASPPAAVTSVVRRRVLVVDDSEANCTVLASQLSSAGYTVLTATSGEQALSLMRQVHANDKPFDVVLADYEMPGMDGARLGEQIKSDPSLAATHMIMLTSVDRKGARGEFAAGFDAYLSKPIRIRELVGCIQRVLTSQTRDSTSSADPASARSRANEKIPSQHYAGRILVVEDNAVNQKVAQRFLERLGCEVVIADNGEIAVHTCTSNRFDLILMDLQMPVMDGYSATREIRAMERAGVRTPIIALTANAMFGQQERCLAADMDGLLTKPLSVDRLRETLDSVGLRRDANAAVAVTV